MPLNLLSFSSKFLLTQGEMQNLRNRMQWEAMQAIGSKVELELSHKVWSDTVLLHNGETACLEVMYS